MLASLLPGLREVRTPLAVGYLWFVNFWLLFSDRLPRTSSEAHGYVWPRLFELGGIMGRAAVVAAVSFGAYLFGSLVKFEPPPWVIAPPIFLPFWPKWLTEKGWYTLPRSYRATAKELTSHRKEDRNLWETIRDVMSHQDELRTRLLIEDRELYGEYDRISAEGEFHVNVTLPVAVLLIILANDLSPVWLLGLVPLLWFGYQGINRAHEAVAVLMRALMVNKIEHPVFAPVSEVGH
jgi:hypothetical protein